MVSTKQKIGSVWFRIRFSDDFEKAFVQRRFLGLWFDVWIRTMVRGGRWERHDFAPFQLPKPYNDKQLLVTMEIFNKYPHKLKFVWQTNQWFANDAKLPIIF